MGSGFGGHLILKSKLKNMKRASTLLVVALAVSFWTGCKKDELCNPALDLDKMEEKLHQFMDNKVMGYAYVIAQDGNVKRSDDFGNARATNDGLKEMTINERMQVASLSKTITTITALSVLDELNIDPNTSISAYLPSNWVQGAGISNISFANLLNHSAGMNNVGTQGGSATLKDSLKLYISQGASQPETPSYSNTHHALFRIMLPKMLGYTPAAGGPEGDDAFYANAYKQIVQDRVFTPLGISNADCSPPAINPALAYASGADLLGMGGTNDFSTVAGGIGWNLSAYEMAKVWAYLWFTEDLISTDMRTLMKNSEMGLFNSMDGDHGRYYCKLGGWTFNNTTGDGFNSCIMHFPDGTQVVIFTNSPHLNSMSLRTIASQSFDQSYGCF